jgi:hypothetical protein
MSKETISMSIYKPTWLYIKQHNQTGLKYFGKTVAANPEKYPGSGIRWSNHLKVHGNDVTTVWSKLFESEDELKTYALQFSVENDIVKSPEWANLIFENGMDGFPIGVNTGPKTEQTKQKISEANKGRKRSAKTCSQMSASHMGLKVWNAGIKTGPLPIVQCPHCGKSGGSTLMLRWHFDNCRLK